jgi:hypothetical protein
VEARAKETPVKKNEIKVGDTYIAKVSGTTTVVRVDAVRERGGYRSVASRRRVNASTSYDVTNLATGRKTVFRSAQRFLRAAVPADFDKKIRKGAAASVTETEPTDNQEIERLETAVRGNGEGEQGPDPLTPATTPVPSATSTWKSASAMKRSSGVPKDVPAENGRTPDSG